jgi:bifunctional ADP-heptose synthase (sugar kinase/adenylyltransferase)
MKAFRVKAVDTTAAGDAFMGALACGLAENKPIREALRFANAAGALATTKLGAQPSLPFRKEVKTFVKNHLKEIGVLNMGSENSIQYQRVLVGKQVFINKKLIMPDPISI